ncbi:hypothetical protein J4443_01065 [Candidatus Woesearchaeota archaeon]|nr:hypothetical protein [Candidatus Woesearchaeota archaeon]
MKRGQGEIIGLVVVVLLLVFALIFFVKIKSSDDENESRLIRSNLRANSALNALMKVHVEDDDEKRQMKDLIEECILTNNCDDVSSNLMYYLEDPTQGIFTNEKYRLIVSGDHDLVSLGNDCKSSISASPFILRNGKVEFKICT